MKRYFLALACCALLLVGCAQQSATPQARTSEGVQPTSVDESSMLADKPPMLMVDDVLYLDTGRESDIAARCGVMDGEITSSVSSAESPTENHQSNFGSGYGYQRVDESALDVLIDEKWMRFESELARTLGVSLTTTDVTPTGLTLLCTQTGGQPSGAIQTGSSYRLEVRDGEQWTQVPMQISEHAWGRTDEAWIIPLNDSTQWSVDWTTLYGALPTGEYRLAKEIMDFRGAGDFSTQIGYAQFWVDN